MMATNLHKKCIIMLWRTAGQCTVLRFKRSFSCFQLLPRSQQETKLRKNIEKRISHESYQISANSSTFCKKSDHYQQMASGSAVEPIIDLKKVAVIGKMTRYEFEKQRYDGYTENQFKEVLRMRGSNYDALLAKHQNHLKSMEYIKQTLSDRGIDFRICTRGKTSDTKESVAWADAVFTAGGDGTFLSTATKISDRKKPLIGINTSPDRSEGHLCLPAKYTSNLNEAIDKLIQGKFKWLFRQRIRITLTGCETNSEPVENGTILRQRMLGNYQNTPSPCLSDDELDDNDNIQDHDTSSHAVLTKRPFKNVLPILALNEIFMGESIASVPSLYKIQADDRLPEKQKSSGVCICTGTGSTAWSYNICRLHSSSVHSLLNIAHQISDSQTPSSRPSFHVEENVINQATEQFAQSFVFDPDESKMLFSVRDPMQNKVYSCNQPYGWAKSIIIRSRCWDATLCIDGDTSFPFNDGATAKFEILSSDALRTVVLDEDL